MELKHGIHLGYCTNIHRGETWAETFHGLDAYTRRVRQRVCPPDRAYGIGLRLGHTAAEELKASPEKRDDFKRWLEDNNSYVFTINGFPYGKFHGTRVKEQVYAPDWTSQARVDYTNTLFDLLCEFLPPGMSGSVSTLPGSFKEFIQGDGEAQADDICRNLIVCGHHILERVSKTGQDLHLGLEPEPLGYFENTAETVAFFDRLRASAPDKDTKELSRVLGVNYDTCHLAIQYEQAGEALGKLHDAGIRISKIHLSSALRLAPTDEALARLRAFDEEVYLHQVIIRHAGGELTRFRDLPEAFAFSDAHPDQRGEEWRVHFHVPIHARPEEGFDDTRDHVIQTLETIAASPGLCQHFEMETYTWEVLPAEMRSAEVVDQLEKEYGWCLGEFQHVGLA